MVLAGLGLNPAGVSLFRMHAPQSPLISAWGLNPARVCHGFALLLTVSQMLFRQPVWGRSDPPLALESCWGFHVSHACPTETIWRGIGFRLGLKSCQVCHGFGLLYNGFEDAVSAARQGTNWPPLGLESCWGFFVSLVVAMLGFLCLWLHCWGFLCLWLHHLFCFFRPSERNVREFYGGWFWQVWAWILLGFPCFACMPHRALWLPLAPKFYWSDACLKDCHQRLQKAVLKWWLSLKIVIKHRPKFYWIDGWRKKIVIKHRPKFYWSDGCRKRLSSNIAQSSTEAMPV